MNTIPIIDTHQHLWDLSKLRLSWLTANHPLAKNHFMSDYLREAEGLNIVKTIYMEVDAHDDYLLDEADYVLDLCARDDNPMVGAVIGGRPASPEFGEYIAKFEGNPYIKGMRQCIHVDATPPGYCLTPEFISGVRLLGDAGLCHDICIRAAELLDAAKLIDLCPQTQFILDHCGNANVQAEDRSQWERDIREVSKRENVVCKISGIIASAKPERWKPSDLAPIILHCLEVFGIDRVMFASDWPVCTQTATLRQWIGALRSIVTDLPEADQRKLFGGNAESVYGV
jgi:L-fuconolactonase